MASLIGWIVAGIIAAFTTVGVLGLLGTSVLLGVRRVTGWPGEPAVVRALDTASVRRAA